MYRKTTKEETEKIINLYKSGINITQISAEVKIKRTTIGKILKKNQIVTKNHIIHKMKKCLTCERLTKNKKYCSRQCKPFNPNIGIKPKTKQSLCKRCNSLICIGYTNKSYCNDCLKYSKTYNYDNYQLLTLQMLLDKYSNYEVHAKIRDKARRNFKNKNINACQRCGYDKHIEVCHIKPIKLFDLDSTIAEINHIDNLIGLCPNCHWEFDNNLLK